MGALSRIRTSLGDIDSVANDVLSNAVIAEVCKLVNVEGDATKNSLSTEQIQCLTLSDKQLLCDAMFHRSKEEIGSYDASDPNTVIATRFRNVLAQFEESTTKLAESLKPKFGLFRHQMDSLAGAGSALSKETMQMLDQLTTQSVALKSALQKPDWLKMVDEQRKLVDSLSAEKSFGSPSAKIFEAPTGRLTVAPRNVPQFDWPASPMSRTANAVEQHTVELEKLAEAQRLALDINNQMHGLVAKVAQELSVRAASNERQATLNFWVAITAIFVSSIAACSQIFQAHTYNKDTDAQLAKSQEIAREQRDSLNAILKESQRNGQSSRQQLQSAPPAMDTAAAKSKAPK